MGVLPGLRPQTLIAGHPSELPSGPGFHHHPATYHTQYVEMYHLIRRFGAWLRMKSWRKGRTSGPGFWRCEVCGQELPSKLCCRARHIGGEPPPETVRARGPAAEWEEIESL
jgi:hypothetical protein